MMNSIRSWRLVASSVMMFAGSAIAAGPFYFSIDLGSDLEVSDPVSPGPYDCGDVYGAPATVPGGDAEKDDALIDVPSAPPDPPPTPSPFLPAPVGVATPADVHLYTNFFDLDAEDQLPFLFGVPDEGIPTGIPMTAAVHSCLWKNPNRACVSFDDDMAPGWVAVDTPPLAPPDKGSTSARDEILAGQGWATWTPLAGVADEVALGLGPNPDAGPESDDDVDALDKERCDFWYWSADHEANFGFAAPPGGFDPGAIYVTTLPGGGTLPVIPQTALGLVDAPGTPGVLEDADIDAFEFCTTDDPAIVSAFPGTAPGTEYLAVVFSVDDDDPVTPFVDESGGLSPGVLYISLMQGFPPLPLSDLGEDVDALAFDGGAECIKWQQAPDCEDGLDVESWALHDFGFGESISISAVYDDWLCDGRPVTGVRWWGSYLFYEHLTGTPTPPDETNRPYGFQLEWREDLNGVPGGLIHKDFYHLAPFASAVTPGWVSENYECVTDLSNVFDKVEYEHEYEYAVVFTNEWLEKPGTRYWLCIQAVMTNSPFEVWGWKTTTPEYRYGAPAYSLGLSGATNMTWPPPSWPSASNHPYAGLPVDQAFEMLTDICPSRCTKWSQPPDMTSGTDLLSWRHETTNDSGSTVFVLRADDFISDGRLITDVHWWGSYPGWSTNAPGYATNQVAPPTGPLAPTGFVLSWHDAAAGCVPGTVLDERFVPIEKCHEMFYGSILQTWNFGAWEHEYQYYVDLLDPNVDGFGWPETNGGHYFLNVQAVFDDGFDAGISHDGWGWHAKPMVTNCPAVYSTNGVAWMPGPPAPPLPSYDHAFELTTTAIPTNAGSAAMGFTNIYKTAEGDLLMVSTGHCGCGSQVLQTSTNLLNTNAWLDIETRVAPMPVNTWFIDNVASQQFFRIKKRYP